MKILVDTHTLIWALQNNRSLSHHHRSLLANRKHEKIVSQVSFMGLAVKINIGKLPNFTVSLQQFIEQTT